MVKAKLIELIREIGREEQALFGNLAAVERSALGEADRWAPKDVLAHIAAWKERQAENFAAAARGEPQKRYDDYESINAKEFQDFRDAPWEEIIQKADRANRRVLEQIESMSEEKLQGLRENNDTEWQGILGTAYVHTVSHLGQIYAERGKKDLAHKLAEQTAAELLKLDDGRRWEGTVKYNLACHRALTGDTEQAIRGLREALALRPDLKEWSKEDTDFASIRSEPGYLAIYKE
jgi:tetratricopeptide (TPR) repeat protein